MPFNTPVNTIVALRIQLHALASLKGGMRVDCGAEAKANYTALKVAARGACTWNQFIIECTVERADPNPKPRHSMFPHRCGHDSLLVEAQDGADSRCFILDDTALQWDLPVEAKYVAPATRGTAWNEYVRSWHAHSKPMSPPLNLSAGAPRSSIHILAEGADRNAAINDWCRRIALHPFAISAGNAQVLSVAESDTRIV